MRLSSTPSNHSKSPRAFCLKGGFPPLWPFHVFLSLPQRHFCVFALSIPGQDALSRIYSTILTQHLTSGNFSGAVQKSAQQLIALALGLHQKVAATFLPTAIKFHYIFNLRDFSNIFQVSAVAVLWHLELVAVLQEAVDLCSSSSGEQNAVSHLKMTQHVSPE